MKWFKPFGWIYLPVSTVGFLLTGLLLSAFVHDFLFVNGRSHSISDLFYNFSPYGFMYVAAWLWFASKTTTKSK
jgi:uncharacterized membrane protein